VTTGRASAVSVRWADGHTLTDHGWTDFHATTAAGLIGHPVAGRDDAANRHGWLLLIGGDARLDARQ
jgi:hypothetical protein